MSGSEMRDPYEDYQTINQELEKFNPKLMKRPMVILANKMDLPNAEENLKKFKEKVKDKKIFAITAMNGQGLQEVIDYLADLLDTIKEENLYDEDAFESHVLYQFKEEQPFTIEKEDDVWVIKGDKIEKLFKMAKLNTEEGQMRFARRVSRMGIDDKLEELGAKEGDMVRILDFYFEYRK